MIQKEFAQASITYRKFRERCGIKDPVMLDEIEEAYFKGAEETFALCPMELINKIRAEVEKKTHGERGYSSGDAECGYRDCAIDILSFLDTLEVKAVNLDEKIKDYIYAIPHAKTGIPNGWRLSWNEENVIEIAKHFYELGLQKGD